MTIYIPEWALWLIAVPIAAAVLTLAWFGWVVLKSMRGGIWK